MTYTKNREGYLIPSLSLPNQPNPYLNRYARLRLEYLEQNEPTLCDQLMLESGPMHRSFAAHFASHVF